MKDTESSPTVSEQPCATASSRRRITIGLPSSADPAERRFPITPEAAQMLTDRGFAVKMQTGAAAPIHYSDNAYSRVGVGVCSRSEALGCDIVIHLAPLPPADISAMRRGAMLLSLLSLARQTKATIKALTDRNIIAIAIDLVKDRHGNTPFADILSEINGLAAMTIASAILADPLRGKGILLGGVAGVIPCETAVIGSDLSARAAAKAAIGAGSSVRMFDNDVYSLREAIGALDGRGVGSTLHPRVLANALRTADIVIVADSIQPPVIDSSEVADMKKGVLVFDLSHDPGRVFPSLPCIDLATAAAAPTEGCRCFSNTGNAVPRTAAMALSNSFITFFNEIASSEGALNALKMLPGIKAAAYTFMKNVVNPQIAEIAGCRAKDINIFLTLS